MGLQVFDFYCLLNTRKIIKYQNTNRFDKIEEILAECYYEFNTIFPLSLILQRLIVFNFPVKQLTQIVQNLKLFQKIPSISYNYMIEILIDSIEKLAISQAFHNKEARQHCALIKLHLEALLDNNEDSKERLKIFETKKLM